MHTPGLAIAWSLWWRHRWGFVASGATLLVLAIIYPFLFSYTRATAAVVASIFPLVGVFGYVLNALLLAEEPGSMSSSYPRSMLALPVRTSTLVISPLLCGTLAATLLWVATSVMVYRPSGFEVPVLLPALALAAAMAWLLALGLVADRHPLAPSPLDHRLDSGPRGGTPMAGHDGAQLAGAAGEPVHRLHPGGVPGRAGGGCQRSARRSLARLDPGARARSQFRSGQRQVDDGGPILLPARRSTGTSGIAMGGSFPCPCS